jgi:chromosomal replication initiator protein
MEGMLGTGREPRFTHPRTLVMHLSREFTKASYPVIGRAFKRDHSTVITAVRRSHDLIDMFPEYYDKRQAVIDLLQLTPR